MKICSPQLGLSQDSSLGGEVYDHQTIKGFTKKNIKVLVYLPKGKLYDKNLRNLKVTYSWLSHVTPPILYSFVCLPYLLRIYKTEKFDVLRIHSARFLGIAGLIFHYLHPEVPILVSEVTPVHRKIFHYIEKEIYNVSSAIIVQSNYMKEMLINKFNVKADKIFVTYGGQLKLKKIHKSSKQTLQFVQKSDFVLLYMGLLEPRKNPKFLLDVLSETLKEIPNAKLVYIGNGVEKDLLIKIAVQKKIKNKVVFIDKVYNEEKFAWLSRMNIFVLPSRFEGFGLAVTEAMSNSKPVIVSDIKPFKEIIKNGFDGFTLPLNVTVWKKTITKLNKDEQLRKKISQNAKKKINKHFSWEKTYSMNKKVIDLITS